MKKPKFNPRQQVSIHNPYPGHKWPHRKGARVLVLHDGLRILEAVVDWYLPARLIDADCLVTPGVPLLFCVSELGRRGYTLSEVAPRSRNGRLKLLREIEKCAGAAVARRHELYTAALAAWGAAVRAREEFEKNSLLKAC